MSGTKPSGEREGEGEGVRRVGVGWVCRSVEDRRCSRISDMSHT
jgi:hypothetical protein